MRLGKKRLNKRQFKKLTSDNYYIHNKKVDAIFEAGFQNFNDVAKMIHYNKETLKIIEKAKGALIYALKVYGMSLEDLIKKYKEHPIVNEPHMESATLNDALDDLQTDSTYISDRFLGEGKLIRFLFRLDLCKYFLGLPTISEIKFKTESELVEDFKNIFETQLNKNFSNEEFELFYNNKIKDLETTNQSFDDNVYNLYAMNKYEALTHLKYVVNLKKDIIKDGNLSLFDLYQLMFALKQTEYQLNYSLYTLKNVQLT